MGSPLLFFLMKMPKTLGPQGPSSRMTASRVSLSLLLSSVQFPYLSKPPVTEEARRCSMTRESGVNAPLHANL